MYKLGLIVIFLLLLFNVFYFGANIGHEVGYSSGLSDKILRDYEKIECKYKK